MQENPIFQKEETLKPIEKQRELNPPNKRNLEKQETSLKFPEYPQRLIREIARERENEILPDLL